MHIVRRELPIIVGELPQRELELRSELAAAHLEAQEARARQIDADQLVARYRLRSDAAEKTIATLSQQSRRWEREALRLEREALRLEREALQKVAQVEARCCQLQAEMGALRSSRWLRLGNKIRATMRRLARPLPTRVKGVLRSGLRKLLRALPV
jgi:hypothetical protein